MRTALVQGGGFLAAEGTLTFLDRLHRQLQGAEPDAELREALVRLWWLRRQRPRGSHDGAIAGSGHAAHLVQQVVCQRLDAHWAKSYRRVSDVLRQTVRASSAVECMNSVLRMHQSRHRTVTQGLLDLKRLHWNCRAFAGEASGSLPLRTPGTEAAELRLLERTPDADGRGRLTQEVSSSRLMFWDDPKTTRSRSRCSILWADGR